MAELGRAGLWEGWAKIGPAAATVQNFRRATKHLAVGSSSNGMAPAPSVPSAACCPSLTLLFVDMRLTPAIHPSLNRDLGLVDRLPRLVCAQAQNANPLCECGGAAGASALACGVEGAIAVSPYGRKSNQQLDKYSHLHSAVCPCHSLPNPPCIPAPPLLPLQTWPTRRATTTSTPSRPRPPLPAPSRSETPCPSTARCWRCGKPTVRAVWVCARAFLCLCVCVCVCTAVCVPRCGMAARWGLGVCAYAPCKPHASRLTPSAVLSAGIVEEASEKLADGRRHCALCIDLNLISVLFYSQALWRRRARRS